MSYSIVGAQIQKFRKEMGLTQRELGEALGISSSAVSQWESGGTPDVALLPAIADKLHVPIDALFGREGGEVQDMERMVMRWMLSQPEGQRLDALCRMIFEALKVIAVSNVVEVGYLSKCVVPFEEVDGGAAMMPSLCKLDDGIATGVFAEDMSFAAIFPEPKDGYAAFFSTNEEYRNLFRALIQPGVLEIWEYLSSTKIKYFTPGAVAKRMGIPVEQATDVLSIMAKANLLRPLELENDTGETEAYCIEKTEYLPPFLYFCRLILGPLGICYFRWDPRKNPVLRLEDK